ncbi:MAG: sigma factor-like helix-turn-helix DNA-binding protein [Candidatus Azambacteria bacterium]|nr:sigma factor-like helix-turn-helix DNA-binding protein [Candidatus Azambacteria bacterium]
MPGQNIKNILSELIKVLNPRTREVIEKRFGLRSVSCQTLEAIGQNLGVTRERVRQIESLGLKQLVNKNVLEPLKPAFETIEKHLTDYGGVRREDYFLRELSQLFSLKENNNENLIDFVLALRQGKFIYFKETPKWRAAWALNNSAYNNAISLGEALRKKLAEQNLPILREVVLKTAASLSGPSAQAGEMNDKALFSCIELCREIAQNPFGEWGFIGSPEVSPKGVKDKAYLIFKKEKKPLHFAQVAELINQVAFEGRQAHPQTVHNELIKDPRFVLVGRGTYALADWGYEPGTVRDVLVSALKNAKEGLTKDEIIELVKSKRMVKDNTILLNLQNKKVFKKIDNERFTLL